MPYLTLRSPGGYAATCASQDVALLARWLDEWIPQLSMPGYCALIGYRGPCWTGVCLGEHPDWPADARVMGYDLQVPHGLTGTTVMQRLEQAVRRLAEWWDMHPDGTWNNAPTLDLGPGDHIQPVHHLPHGTNRAACGAETGHLTGATAVITCPTCRATL